MSSPLSFLTELYRRNTAYFQRMLEFFLQSRFKTVRLFLKDKRREQVFFSIDGELIDCTNNRRRFNTLTEWYNAAMGTTFAEGVTSIFTLIHISQRVSIQAVLHLVSHKEVEEFLDLKHRSNQVYGFIMRRLRARHISCDLAKRQTFHLKWQDRLYTVDHTKVVTEGGYSVGPLLDYVCGPEHQLTGLYYVDKKKVEHLLTEDIAPVPAAAIPEAKPVEAAESSLKSEMHMLHDKLGIEMETMHTLLQSNHERTTAELRAEFLSEIAKLRSDNEALQITFAHQQHAIQALQTMVGYHQQTVEALQLLTVQHQQTIQTLVAQDAYQQQTLQALQTVYGQQQQTIQGLQSAIQHYHQAMSRTMAVKPAPPGLHHPFFV